VYTCVYTVYHTPEYHCIGSKIRRTAAVVLTWSP